MDSLKSIALATTLLLCQALSAQQINNKGETPKKNAIGLNGARFGSLASVSYSYTFWQNKTNTFRTGAQTGIGYSFELNSPTFQGINVPLGLFAEYGKKHRIGVDANLIYSYRLNTIRMEHPSYGYQDYKILFNVGVFTTSLHYSYNFGSNQKYQVGIGYNFMAFFGENYGQKVNIENHHAPFIFFGVRF